MVNVCRVPMTPELVPNVSVWLCTVPIAAFRAVTVLVSVESFWNDAPPVPAIDDSERPDELKVTPWIVSELDALWLKLIVRLSPLSRLMPL